MPDTHRKHDPFEQCLKEVTSNQARQEIGVFRVGQRVLIAEIFRKEKWGRHKRPPNVTDEHVDRILRYARRVLQEVLN